MDASTATTTNPICPASNALMKTKYFAKNELDSLPFKEVLLKRDTKDETFFYFRNCFISVDSKGNINELPYSSVDNYIWESNKIKFDYVTTSLEILNDKDELLPYDNINCEFAKFVALASYNPHNEDEKHFTRAQITQRFLSFFQKMDGTNAYFLPKICVKLSVIWN